MLNINLQLRTILSDIFFVRQIIMIIKDINVFTLHLIKNSFNIDLYQCIARRCCKNRKYNFMESKTPVLTLIKDTSDTKSKSNQESKTNTKSSTANPSTSESSLTQPSNSDDVDIKLFSKPDVVEYLSSLKYGSPSPGMIGWSCGRLRSLEDVETEEDREEMLRAIEISLELDEEVRRMTANTIRKNNKRLRM